MEHLRSISMDLTLSISGAASMDSMSDDKIAIIVPHSSPILSKSPSNHNLPQWVHSEASHPAPSSEKRAAPALVAKKVAAEFLGTFLLIFILLSTLIVDEAHGGALGPLGVAAAAGSAVAVVVASLAHVSGAHLNPAVSAAMAAFGYLPRAQLAPYVAAQLLGSTVASFAAKAVYNDPADLGATVATVPALGTAGALVVEFVTTFVLLFVITALATDPKAVKELVAVGTGAAVMMNALISAESTGASMNPARTLGPAIASGTYTKIWIYMVAPPLGAIAGTGAYVALK
ncbi:hypothetical protein PAHAL_6G033100 [Panicum hallii]|uniref:Aquaporin n=1 Tax=Panicum hallii TaxID=206008 RepID=A0A2S3I063_9POAL|nr:hypothetical protein PAHAL_6G033100 [Panicum hallii]